jgi:hypothetical protein
MAYPNHRHTLIIFMTLLPLAVLFATGVYKSVNSVEKPDPVFYQSNTVQKSPFYRNPPGTPVKKVSSGNLFLHRNEKTFINKTCMVFKGIFGNKVMLEMVFLELDPDTPYPMHFSKETFENGVWLADVQYRLVSVKKNGLRLEILDTY